MGDVIDLTDLSSDEEEDNKANVQFLSPHPANGQGSASAYDAVHTKFFQSQARNGGFASGSGSGVDRVGHIHPAENPFSEYLEKPQVHGIVSGATKGGTPSTSQSGMRAGTAAGAGAATIEMPNMESTTTGHVPWGEPLSPELLSRRRQDQSPREKGNHRTAAGVSNQTLHGRGDSGGVENLHASDSRTPTATTRKSQRLNLSPGSTPSSVPSSAPRPPSSSGSGVCRNFWRAGDYEAQQTGPASRRGSMDHVRVHPKFLHSNATSHKWALGAMAELLDNAVDEVQNGATYVKIDKINIPRDNSLALLILDDGGGMSPETMRQCMSLGYSAKNTNTTIGQYGNGFKTSTMRLGADVVVFSRCADPDATSSTLSIGLLSYTFLRETGMEDVVVPMIDYRVTTLEGRDEPPQRIIRSTPEDWLSNLETVTRWSPYSTEKEILDSFLDIGLHGTKIVVYNLWMNDDGIPELDFVTDEHDIQLRGSAKSDKTRAVQAQLVENHIANRYRHSLRIYSSILYLNMPPNFQIILRGKPVEHHAISDDLKFSEQIIYKPQIGNNAGGYLKDVAVITTIGFTKEAPLVNVHGFNVYHKNRLIMPFWKVFLDNSSRGRGVVGVLEANFVEPAHDKQDFERTSVLQRLETRLKQMTVEYWNFHCHLIGYQANARSGKSKRPQPVGPGEFPAPVSTMVPAENGSSSIPVIGSEDGSDGMDMPPSGQSGPIPAQGLHLKTEPADGTSPHPSDSISETVRRYKRQRTADSSQLNNPGPVVEADISAADKTLAVRQSSEERNEAIMYELIQENANLKAKCNAYECELEKMSSKVSNLEKEVKELRAKKQTLKSLQEIRSDE